MTLLKMAAIIFVCLLAGLTMILGDALLGPRSSAFDHKRAVPHDMLSTDPKDTNDHVGNVEPEPRLLMKYGQDGCPSGLVPHNGSVCCVPVYCTTGNSIEACSKDGESDQCRPCPAGSVQTNNVTSFKMEEAGCFPNKGQQRCPEGTKMSRKQWNDSCAQYCECENEGCYWGDDPCMCNWQSEVCGVNQTMNRHMGDCEPCAWHSYKPYVGCGPCIFNSTLYGLGKQTYSPVVYSPTALVTRRNSTAAGVSSTNTTSPILEPDPNSKSLLPKEDAHPDWLLGLIIALVIVIVIIAGIVCFLLYINCCRKKDAYTPVVTQASLPNTPDPEPALHNGPQFPPQAVQAGNQRGAQFPQQAIQAGNQGGPQFPLHTIGAGNQNGPRFPVEAGSQLHRHVQETSLFENSSVRVIDHQRLLQSTPVNQQMLTVSPDVYPNPPDDREYIEHLNSNAIGHIHYDSDSPATEDDTADERVSLLTSTPGDTLIAKSTANCGLVKNHVLYKHAESHPNDRNTGEHSGQNQNKNVVSVHDNHFNNCAICIGNKDFTGKERCCVGIEPISGISGTLTLDSDKSDADYSVLNPTSGNDLNRQLDIDYNIHCNGKLVDARNVDVNAPIPAEYCRSEQIDSIKPVAVESFFLDNETSTKSLICKKLSDPDNNHIESNDAMCDSAGVGQTVKHYKRQPSKDNQVENIDEGLEDDKSSTLESSEKMKDDKMCFDNKSNDIFDEHDETVEKSCDSLDSVTFSKSVDRLPTKTEIHANQSAAKETEPVGQSTPCRAGHQLVRLSIWKTTDETETHPWDVNKTSPEPKSKPVCSVSPMPRGNRAPNFVPSSNSPPVRYELQRLSGASADVTDDSLHGRARDYADDLSSNAYAFLHVDTDTTPNDIANEDDLVSLGTGLDGNSFEIDPSFGQGQTKLTTTAGNRGAHDMQSHITSNTGLNLTNNEYPTANSPPSFIRTGPEGSSFTSNNQSSNRINTDRKTVASLDDTDLKSVIPSASEADIVKVRNESDGETEHSHDIKDSVESKLGHILKHKDLDMDDEELKMEKGADFVPVRVYEDRDESELEETNADTGCTCSKEVVSHDNGGMYLGTDDIIDAGNNTADDVDDHQSNLEVESESLENIEHGQLVSRGVNEHDCVGNESDGVISEDMVGDIGTVRSL